MKFVPGRLWSFSLGLVFAGSIPGIAIAQEMPDFESLNSDRGTPFPQFVQQQWMSICMGEEGTAMQPFCRCMLDELQMNYSLQEFIELGLQLNEGGATPPKLTQIANSCAAS